MRVRFQFFPYLFRFSVWVDSISRMSPKDLREGSLKTNVEIRVLPLSAGGGRRLSDHLLSQKGVVLLF